jgi:hypothetical protein
VSHDPLIDLRDREDMRENYLDGLVSVSESETPRARLSKPPAPRLAELGGGCGATYGHDWPGRADGAPHPRRTS